MEPTTPPQADKPRPPLPKFWATYSPNQELPLSGLTSIALHVGAAVALALFFQFYLRHHLEDTMPVEAIIVDGDPNAGGGGDPGGSSVTDAAGPGRVERASADELPRDTPAPNITLGALPDPRNELPEVP